MGLFDKFLKNDDSSKKGSSKDSSSSQSNLGINLSSRNSQNKNFRYLDNLIQGSKNIKLDYDITLDSNEASVYVNGIRIDQDNLIIDFNNHVVDASNKVSIFEVYGKGIVFKNAVFKNAFGEHAGVIGNFGEIELINCKFIDNRVNGAGAAINIQGGSLKAESCEFSKNHALVGAAIYSMKGTCKVSNSTFLNNKAEINGAAVFNVEEFELNSCKFIENRAETGSGGAIYSNSGNIRILDCEFSRNFASKNAGGILNNGDMLIEKSDFNENSADAEGGAINHQKGFLNISKSKFKGNHAKLGGGVIFSFSNAELKDSFFTQNSVKQGGAVINCQDNSIKAVNCEFLNNVAAAGAVSFNYGNLSFTESKFIENSVDLQGGVFYNHGTISVNQSVFKGNRAKEDANDIYNLSEISIFNSEFSDTEGSINNIFNKGSLDINESKFYDNKSNAILYNDSSSKLSVKNSNFNDNSSNSAAIYNLSENCDLSSLIFKNNGSIIDNCGDILNKGFIGLHSPSFKDKSKTVINEGKMDLAHISRADANDIISGDGELTFLTFDDEFDDNEFNFTYLDDLIHGNLSQSDDEDILLDDEDILQKKDSSSPIKGLVLSNQSNESDTSKTYGSSDKNYGSSSKNYESLNNSAKKVKIVLKEDISIDDYEIHFYEGGIELDIDNLIIDGNGKTIDSKSKSRIFLVNAKNVVLKNIIFKNGHAYSSFDKHTTGGGAIKVLKDASLSLKNCKFINNESDDDGGAILNNGLLDSSASCFEGNNSKLYGGAIYNYGTFISDDDKFDSNSSKLGASISNYGFLDFDRINLSSNESNISQDIINNNVVKSKMDSNDLNQIVYNLGYINPKESLNISFSMFNENIQNKSQFSLDEDIIFDFKRDSDFKEGIEIDASSLVIDGNGHMIDARNNAGLFRISSNSHVVFKDICFKNAFSGDEAIMINDGNLTFENCSFDNNNASKDSFFIENRNNLKFKSCNFSNNLSRNNALIENNGSLEIEDSNFISNSSLANILNNAPMEQSNLYKSSIDGEIKEFKGNANLIINKTIFMNNSLEINGSVVYNWDDLNISNSKFIDNYAKGDSGAINNRKGAKSSISKSEFLKNSAGVNGGAISNFGNMSIEDSLLDNNFAKVSGGAIVNDMGSDLTITNSRLLNNKSNKNGGAILDFGKLKISSSEFTYNYADEAGGAIAVQESGDLEIYDSSLSKNNSNANPNIICLGSIKAKNNIMNVDFEHFDISLPDNVNLERENGKDIITWRDLANDIVFFFTFNSETTMDMTIKLFLDNGASDEGFVGKARCLKLESEDGPIYWMGFNDDELSNPQFTNRFVSILGKNYDLIKRIIQSVEFK